MGRGFPVAKEEENREEEKRKDSWRREGLKRRGENIFVNVIFFFSFLSILFFSFLSFFFFVNIFFLLNPFFSFLGNSKKLLPTEEKDLWDLYPKL